VTKLSAGGALLGTYKVGRGPFGLIAVGPDVFVSCFFDGVVLKLSGSSGAELTRVDVGDGAAGLAQYGQNYVVANNGSNSITVFSAEGAVISTIRVGRSPLYVAANAYGYWSANTGGDTVSKR
jgi:DNA-binding beta-propeller fold protein YncE